MALWSNIVQTMLAGVGIAVLGVYIGQLHTMKRTLVEIRTGGKDTHDLAVAAAKQADAAKAQSRQAEAQTKKMGESLRKTDALIRQSTEQAKATNKLAVQAKRSADEGESLARIAQKSLEISTEEMRLDQRAWVWIRDVVTSSGKEIDQPDPISGKPVHLMSVDTVDVLLANTGKTPALGVTIGDTILTTRKISDRIPDYDAVKEEIDKRLERFGVPSRARSVSPPGPPPGQVIPPTATEWVTVAQKSAFGRSPDEVGYILGKFSYYDTFRDRLHYTKYCLMSPPGTTRFVVCPDGNWMD